MAFDQGLADLLRDDLVGLHLTEKKMFGGLCFMTRGHMLCGVHKGGVMVRVGAPNYDAAVALPGVSPMLMTGRVMKGMVDCDDAALADDRVRTTLLDMAQRFVNSLPAK